MDLKKIALENLRKLRVHDSCIKSFKEEDHIWCSERVRFGTKAFGVLYDANQGGYTYEEEVRQAVEKVKEVGGYPYHVVQTRFEFGNVFAVLYVDEEHGPIEESPEYGYLAASYSYNADEPMFSDFGDVGVVGKGGGVIRTA